MFLIAHFLNDTNIAEQGWLHQLAGVHIQTEAAQAIDRGEGDSSKFTTRNRDSNKYNWTQGTGFQPTGTDEICIPAFIHAFYHKAIFCLKVLAALFLICLKYKHDYLNINQTL